MKALRWWPYLVLFVALVVSVIFYLALPLTLGGPRDFTLNLATEIVGILLTVGLIDAVIRRREAREQRRYKSVALQQLFSPLRDHLRLLFDIYKASVQKKPDKEISRVEDLFSDDYFEQLKRFDLAGPAPVTLPILWFEYIDIERKKFQNELHRILATYGTHLNHETIATMEILANSWFLHYAATMPAPVPGIPGSGAREFRKKRPGQAYNLLQTTMVLDKIREHTEAFSRLLATYNMEVPSSHKITTRDFIWKNNVEPLIGSARVPDPQPKPAESDAEQP
jgi:hypothetical protein